jgi:hypothetical protein
MLDKYIMTTINFAQLNGTTSLNGPLKINTPANSGVPAGVLQYNTNGFLQKGSPVTTKNDPNTIVQRDKNGNIVGTTTTAPNGSNNKNLANTIFVNNAVNNAVNPINNSVSNLQGRVGATETNVSMLQDDVSMLQDDVSMLQDDVSMLQDDVSTLQNHFPLGFVPSATGHTRGVNSIFTTTLDPTLGPRPTNYGQMLLYIDTYSSPFIYKLYISVIVDTNNTLDWVSVGLA